MATPIGHRQDLSPRAVETLSSVTRIYAEDTRHSLPLLRHHGIETRVQSLHEHNEATEAERIVAHVRDVGSAALITDAGTPLISDPGFRVVRACRAAGIEVSPVPGPCAVSAALSVGGLPTDRFQFVGFPPSKAGARRRWYGELASVAHTLVVYESPHRIADSLADLAATFGERREMTLARELTKRFETLLAGTIAEVLERVRSDADQRRGEIVLMVAGTAWRGDASGRAAAGDTDPAGDESPADVPVRSSGDLQVDAQDGVRDDSTDDRDDPDDAAGLIESDVEDVPVTTIGPGEIDRVLGVLLDRLPPKEVARCAAELCGVPRRVAYDRALALRGRGRAPPL